MNIKFRSGSGGGLKAKLVTLTTIAALSGAAVFMPDAAEPAWFHLICSKVTSSAEPTAALTLAK